jgi:flagellin-like protein
MRKGITPIISIIVLLLITVALAGVAWVYLSGFLDTQMATLTIPPNGVYCAGNEVHALVANTGQNDYTIIATDIPVQSMSGGTAPCNNGGAPISPASTPPASIAAGGSGVFEFNCWDATGAGAACACTGTYSVSIGSAGAVQTQAVTC